MWKLDGSVKGWECHGEQRDGGGLGPGVCRGPVGDPAPTLVFIGKRKEQKLAAGSGALVRREKSVEASSSTEWRMSLESCGAPGRIWDAA